MQQELAVHATLRAQGFTAGAKQIQRDSGGVDRASKKAAKSVGLMGTALKRLVQLAAAGGLAVLISQAVQLGTHFDTSLTRINTLVGVAREQVTGWRGELLQLAGEVGRGPTELADALYVVTSAGQRGAEALQIVEQAGKAAAIGLGETREIARAVTAAMNAYGKEVLSASNATDVLVATVREGNLEASDLAPVLGRIVGLASQLGISFQEVGGFIATFTRLGVRADEAVTALRGTMSSLLGPTKAQEDALGQVSMSMADLKAQIREKGLARTLVDLVAAFKGNEDALAAIIPNVRALSGILGTAGSQGEEFIAIERSIADAMGSITEEAFALTQADPAQVFARMRAEIETAKIKITEGLLPVLADAARGVQAWVQDNEDLIAGLGQLLGVLGHLVGALLSVRELVYAIIAMAFARWLLAVAAASQVSALATLDLAGALAATRAGYGKLVALNIASQFQAWAAATGALNLALSVGLVGAIVAVGVALNHLIKKWGEASEAAMRYERQASEVLGVIGQLQHARLTKTPVDPALWVEATNRVHALSTELQAAQKKLDGLRAGPRVEGSGSLISDAQARVEDLDRRLGLLRKTMTQLRQAGLKPTFEELQKWANRAAGGGGSGGGAGGVAGLTKRLEELKAITERYGSSVEDLDEMRQHTRALEQAFVGWRDVLVEIPGEGQRIVQAFDDLDLDIIAKAVELGLDPVKALTGEVDELGVSVRSVVLDAIQLERELESMGKDYEISITLTETVAGQRAPDRLEVPSLTFPVTFDLSQEELDALTAQYRDHVQKQNWKSIYTSMANGLQDSLGRAFESIFTKGMVGFRDFFKDISRLGLNIMSQYLAAELSNMLQRQMAQAGSLQAFLGTGVGGLATLGIVGATVAGANNQGYAALGAALGAAIGTWVFPALGTELGAIVGAWLGSMVKRGSPEFFGQVEAEMGKIKITTSNLGGGSAKVGNALLDPLTKLLDDVLDNLGAELLNLAGGIDLRMKEDWAVVFVDGVAHHFEKDWSAAMSFAVTEILKRADLGGVSDTLKTVIQNSNAGSLEELTQHIDFGRWYERLGLESAAVQFVNDLEEEGRKIRQAMELGLDPGPIVEDYKRRFEDARNALLGIQVDPKQQLAAEIDSWNRERQLMESKLRIETANNKARAALLRSEAEQLRAKLRLDESHLQIRYDMLGAEVSINSAEYELLSAKMEALAALEQAITVAEGILASLPALISDAEKAAAVARAGAAASGRQQRAEQRESIRGEVGRFGMGGVAAEVDQATQWLRDFEQGVHDAGFAAEEAAAVMAAAAGELERRMAEIKERVLGEVGDFLNWDKPLLGSLDDVTDRALALKKDLRDLKRAGELGSAEFDRLAKAVTAAAMAQRRAAIEGAANNLLGQLYDLLGMEEESRQLRWELTVAELQIKREELAIAIAKYHLEADVLAKIDELIGKVVAAGPDLFKPGGGGSAGSYRSSRSSAISSVLADRQRALDLLKEWRAQLLGAARGELRDIVSRFEDINEVLGETPELLATYRLALEQFTDQLLEGVRDLRRRLHEGEFGGVAPRRQLVDARQAFLDQAQAAIGGDLDAIEGLPDLAEHLLSLAREYFAGSLGFRQIFELVDAVLAKVEEATPGNVDTAAADELDAERRERMVTAGDRVVEASVARAAVDISGAVRNAGEEQTLALDRLGAEVRGLQVQVKAQADGLAAQQGSLARVATTTESLVIQLGRRA